MLEFNKRSLSSSTDRLHYVGLSVEHLSLLHVTEKRLSRAYRITQPAQSVQPYQ